MQGLIIRFCVNTSRQWVYYTVAVWYIIWHCSHAPFTCSGLFKLWIKGYMVSLYNLVYYYPVAFKTSFSPWLLTSLIGFDLSTKSAFIVFLEKFLYIPQSPFRCAWLLCCKLCSILHSSIFNFWVRFSAVYLGIIGQYLGSGATKTKPIWHCVSWVGMAYCHWSWLS